VGNIEYGNIEKFCGLLHRKQSDGNIEFNFENGNIDSKTGSNGVKRGPPWGGGGWLLMMIGDAMTLFDPVWPHFTPRFTFDIAVFEVKFDIAVFKVKFVEVDVNFFRYNLPLSKLFVESKLFIGLLPGHSLH